MPSEGLLSIGALSTATGIPIDTIRTWERRYGFPVPERKPSGHRVYPVATVPRLRRAAQAIARGHRAAEVVPASERAVEALLESLAGLNNPSALRGSETVRFDAEAAEPEGSLASVRDFAGNRLKGMLQTEWARRGPIDFLQRFAAPFLAAIGRSWAEGDLEVRHEHFASGVLGDFLRSVRSPLEDRATGPFAALATLPGELHGLGLQMAAVVFATAGWRPLVLGVDTPIPQIAALAREAPLGVVALSCVQNGGSRSAYPITALRRALPRRIPLLVGGRGAPAKSKLKGVDTIPDLAALDHWLRTHRTA